LALSNLNGVAYSYPLRVKQPGDGQSFGYARFQDQMTGFFIPGWLRRQGFDFSLDALA
jgi:hypothetical protein